MECVSSFPTDNLIIGINETSMAQAVKNDYKAAQIPVVKNVLCFICKTSPSKYTCKECSSGLCKGCRHIHNKRFENENHTVRDIRDTCTVVYCLTHEDEKYTKFCTECSILLCEKCVATDHIGHKISTISSVADDMRHAGKKYVKLLNEKVDKMSECLTCLKSNLQMRLDNVLEEKHDATFITSYEYINKNFKQIEQEFDGFDKPEMPNRNFNELVQDLLQLINTELDGKKKPNLEELQLQISNVTKEKEELQLQLEEMKIRTEAEHNKMQLQFAQSVKEKYELVQQLKNMKKRIEENLENNMTITQISTEKEELQLRLKENEIRYTELKQTNQKLEDSIKFEERRYEELEYMSYNEVTLVAMGDEEIAVLNKRVDNLKNDLLKERTASQMFIADISVRMQNWLVKSKEMTTEIKKEAYGNCDTENGMNSAEELKEGFKNLHTNKDNDMGQIETKDSEDKEEPIDQWFRNRDTKLVKVAAKVETDLQLRQLNTDVSQGGERVTKKYAGDTNEDLNVSEETTEAEIGDEKQITVHLINTENTCVRNSNNSYKDNHLEFNQSVDIVDSDAVEVETSGELCDDLQIPYRKESEAKYCENEDGQNVFKGVGKDKNNIQLQNFNLDEIKGDGGGTGITNRDEGDTDEVFYSEETATKGIGDDEEEIASLRNTGKGYVWNTACRPLSDDFGALPIKERIKLMEKQRFLKKNNSE